MRILMILESEYPPDVRVEKEIKALTNVGHSVYLIAISKNPDSKIEELEELKIYRIYQNKFIYKMSALALSLPFYFRFWRKSIQHFLRNQKIDVIHLHDLPLASVIYRLGKKYNIPVVFDFHENRPEIMKLYAHTNSFFGKLLISINKWEQYQMKYSRLADRLILITPEAKEYYQRNYLVNTASTYIVPNYADIEKLKSVKPNVEILQKYRSKFMLIYFGDTGLRRGTNTIIDAAKYLKDRSEIHFVIIGNSKEQHILTKKIKKYKLSNVELTGYLDFTLIISYIMASKAGLCPFLRNIHHDTTYANKLFQYMYFGKPVIVSDCPSQAAIVDQSNVGFVHKADDPVDLAAKIIELKNHTNYSLFCQNAKRLVLEKYNTEIGFRNLLKLYESFEN